MKSLKHLTSALVCGLSAVSVLLPASMARAEWRQAMVFLGEDAVTEWTPLDGGFYWGTHSETSVGASAYGQAGLPEDSYEFIYIANYRYNQFWVGAGPIPPITVGRVYSLIGGVDTYMGSGSENAEASATAESFYPVGNQIGIFDSVSTTKAHHGGDSNSVVGSYNTTRTQTYTLTPAPDDDESSQWVTFVTVKARVDCKIKGGEGNAEAVAEVTHQ